MAEVHSKMSDVKSQVMEAGEPRPGPSGSFCVEEVSSHHGSSETPARHKSSELDLVGRAAAARSRPCRPGKGEIPCEEPVLKVRKGEGAGSSGTASGFHEALPAGSSQIYLLLFLF